MLFIFRVLVAVVLIVFVFYFIIYDLWGRAGLLLAVAVLIVVSLLLVSVLSCCHHVCVPRVSWSNLLPLLAMNAICVAVLLRFPCPHVHCRPAIGRFRFLVVF